MKQISKSDKLSGKIQQLISYRLECELPIRRARVVALAKNNQIITNDGKFFTEQEVINFWTSIGHIDTVIVEISS